MFADTLKKLRKAKQLTQVDLASLMNISKGAVAMWETGKREPDYATTIKLAKLFGVSVDYLIGNSNIPYTADDIADRLGILDKKRTPDEERLYEALKNDEKIRKILIGIYALPESAREGFLQFAAASITREREDNDDK